MTKVCILHTLYYNFSRDKGYTVNPPLMAISLQRPFFGSGQSIHSLLFQPLYNDGLLLSPRWLL